MELNKNGLLFTYLDSIDKPDLLSSYKIKKFPSLNEYAENYLSNLDQKKSNIDINNDSNENMFEYNTSVKGLSNNISNNDTNIQTNQISKINDKFTSNKYDETNDIKNPYSDQLKPQNNSSIEHLKKNFKNRAKKSNIIDYSQYEDKKQTNIEQKINNQKNITVENNKKGLLELYKKISPPDRTRLNSPLFSAFRSSNSKNSYSSKIVKANNNIDYLNLSKSVNSLNDNKINNKSKSFLSEKESADNNAKFHKINKKFSAAHLCKNFLTNYIYSDRDKFKNNYKKSSNKKNRIQMNFSESHISESFIPLNSISNRYNTNKSYSQSVENYWKEKEIKKQIKIQKIRKEKNYKEICEIRDRPEIDENSRKIANKLGYSSSLNVFERLSELARNQIIFNERRINKKKTGSNNYKLKLYKEINYQNYLKRNKTGLEEDKNFKSLKEIENNNNKSFNINFFENIKKEQNKKKKKKKDFINLNKLNKFINKKENQRYTDIGDIGEDNNNLKISKLQKQWHNSYNFENLNEINNLNGNINNIDNKNINTKIMYKKIQFKKNCNHNNINKSLNFNNQDNINIKKNKTIFSNYNSKKNMINHNYTTNDNKNLKIQSIKKQTKNNRINKNINISNHQNLNEIYLFSNKKHKMHNNYISNNNNFNFKENKKYKYDNFKKFNNTMHNINNKNNKSQISSKNLFKKKSSKDFDENQKIINNKLLMDKLNNYFLINLDNNKEFINNNLIDTSKYFKIPLKKIFNKEKSEINLIKSDDYSNNKNESNYNNEKYINIFYNNDSKQIKKNRENIDNNMILSMEINNKKYNKFDNLENFINIPSYSNEEQINNIKKRKLELLKLLDFSSSIGTTNNI